MKEIWKAIKGYEGKYQISNLGRVKSLDYRHTRKEKIMTPRNNGHGYLHIGIYNNNKRHCYYVHRLVAQTFIENPDNLPQVNHKDLNRQNNKVSNLEWCSIEYNNTYAEKHRKIAKKVGCYKDGKLIKVYDAIRDVKKDGFHHSNISSVLKGKSKSAYGYQWKYID